MKEGAERGREKIRGLARERARGKELGIASWDIRKKREGVRESKSGKAGEIERERARKGVGEHAANTSAPYD